MEHFSIQSKFQDFALSHPTRFLLCVCVKVGPKLACQDQKAACCCMPGKVARLLLSMTCQYHSILFQYNVYIWVAELRHLQILSCFEAEVFAKLSVSPSFTAGFNFDFDTRQCVSDGEDPSNKEEENWGLGDWTGGNILRKGQALFWISTLCKRVSSCFWTLAV